MNKNSKTQQFRQAFVPTFLDFLYTLTVEIPMIFLDPSLAQQKMRGSLPRENIKKGLDNLCYRRYTKKKNNGYVFTKKGVKWAKKTRLKNLKLKNKKWDGKWRVVIFDIPKELNKNRDRIRNRLKMLGFYMMQKSVFVMPYSCEEELKELCQENGVVDYVDLIIADSIGFTEKEIRKFYNI